jgi:hypothetical protein
LGQIPIENLQRDLEHWMERLEWVSENKSEYDPTAKHPLIQFCVSAIRNEDATLEWNTPEISTINSTLMHRKYELIWISTETRHLMKYLICTDQK